MMMRAKFRKIVLYLVILGALFSQGSTQNREYIPLSSGGSGIYSDLLAPLFYRDPVSFNSTQEIPKSDQISTLNDFILKISNEASDVIRGIYSENNFALPVVQQPSGQAGFVSTIDGVATQFSMPKKYGGTAILAHNYLSGKYFFDMGIGDVIKVVYGNGEIKEYQISDIQTYQALQPNSPNSQFVDLFSGENLSATQLFKRIYMGNSHLTLQTCIQEGMEDSWGRLFIIANPL